MNLITFDSSKVASDIHQATITLLLTLGYKWVGPSDVVSTEEESLTIPNMWNFHIPKNVTIDSLKTNLLMSRYCWENLTDKNFGTTVPKGHIAVGFYDMRGDFTSREAIDTVSRLAQQTGRKFRVGTPFEMISFYLEKNNPHCPKSFVALGKVWENLAVCLRDDLNGFILSEHGEVWPKIYKVFIVEEID